MNDDELERLLGGAFDAQARCGSARRHDAAPDARGRRRTRPAPASARPQSRSRWLAPLAAAAVILLIAGTVFAIAAVHLDERQAAGRTGRPEHLRIDRSERPSSASSAVAKSTQTKPAKPAKPVHVSLKFGDGQTLGVGMPIIAFLSRPITDATGFAKATKVTVDGRVGARGLVLRAEVRRSGASDRG